MVIDTVCPYSKVRHYGAWSVWPFYLTTPEYHRDGELNVLHHKEYLKNGIRYRKIRGKWVKYGDKKSAYFTR